MLKYAEFKNRVLQVLREEKISTVQAQQWIEKEYYRHIKERTDKNAN